MIIVQLNIAVRHYRNLGNLIFVTRKVIRSMTRANGKFRPVRNENQ